MSPTLGTKEAPLTAAALREIASQEGPAITLLIPDHRPGAQEASRPAMVRGLMRSVAEQAAAQGWNSAELLQPVVEYAAALMIDAGGPGVALFRSPTFFTTLRVPGIKEASATLGRYFHLSSLVAPASVPHDFYILALNRKNLRLYRYSDRRCESVDLPASVPPSMEASLDMDWPGHSLQNRSSAGNSSGSMRAVQFGTSSERESAGEHLHHFFQLVDRGLTGLLHETPLLLAGVHEEVAAYRRAAQSTHILGPEIHGNIDFLTAAEIAERASAAALAHYYQLGGAVLEKFQEMPDRLRTLSTVPDALDAAVAGRVHQLCVVEGHLVSGSVNGAGQEDLVNATIVETLRHGGEIFMLPSAIMPEGISVAAILRF